MSESNEPNQWSPALEAASSLAQARQHLEDAERVLVDMQDRARSWPGHAELQDLELWGGRILTVARRAMDDAALCFDGSGWRFSAHLCEYARDVCFSGLARMRELSAVGDDVCSAAGSESRDMASA